jgi:hypothetical protein
MSHREFITKVKVHKETFVNYNGTAIKGTTCSHKKFLYDACFIGFHDERKGVFEILEGAIGQQYIVDLYDYQLFIGKIGHILSTPLDDFIGISKILGQQMREKYNENDILNAYLKVFEDL